jgi:predicted enzyme related to lactoylglutathione lyase
MARRAAEKIMTSVQFAFVKLVVRDLDAMSGFYQRALNLYPARTIDTDTITEVIMRPKGEGAGFCLVLYKPKDGREITTGNAHGPVGLYVTDADEAFENAIREGASPLQKPFNVAGLRVAFVNDPEGHELEFLARLPA